MRSIRSSRALGALLLLSCVLLMGEETALSAEAEGTDVLDFPLPDVLRPPVAFWKRVYLEVTSDAGLLHDSVHLGVVYEVVRFEPKQAKRARERVIKARRDYWRGVLRGLGGGRSPRDPTAEAALVLLEIALGHPPTPWELKLASRRIRFQLGQRDKFREGLIRSGANEDAMLAAFRRLNLPEDLAYLPHVESSFNSRAYSKYGAAGLWQFMRATGRGYLTIDYVIDERLDPMASTVAATRLLSDNYKALGTWPLAITAYNHGRTGMRRATRKLGTRDIGVIVEKYRSRSFGFASRNFYAQFLAARDIVRAYTSYFGPLDREKPEAADEISLPFYADVRTLQKYLGVAPEVIRHYNPALRPVVFRSGKRIPKGYQLRLPAGTVGPDATRWVAQVPREFRYTTQRVSHYHRVRRGDTLGKIAQANRTTVSAIASLNNLPSRHRIYAGQVLELPQRPKSKPSRSIVRKARATVKPPADQIEPAPFPPPPLDNDSPWRRVDKGVVIVDADETLGHFADWLEIPASRLRKLNSLSQHRQLRMGQRLRLDLSRVSEAVLLQRRIEFHKAIEEDFFGSYRVAGTVTHRLGKGESLWVVAHRTYGVPLWLVHRYNPETDLRNPAQGQPIKIPVVERNGGS